MKERRQSDGHKERRQSDGHEEERILCAGSEEDEGNWIQSEIVNTRKKLLKEK